MHDPQYVFIGGLHRSGTTLLADLVARHPCIASIRNAPVPEQEGVYLQGAIPHTAQHGIPGAFAEDPDQHLTEESPYNSLETKARLSADWQPWFDPARPWRLEKSPVNLLRGRLYQQLFPMAHHIFLVRHPLAVTRATAKWSERGEMALLDHWQRAHKLLADDLAYLHCALVLRYEDLCADPAGTLGKVAAFLGLSAAPLQQDLPQIRNSNAGYLTAPPLNDLPPLAADFGYDASGVAGPLSDRFACRHVFRDRREAAGGVHAAG